MQSMRTTSGNPSLVSDIAKKLGEVSQSHEIGVVMFVERSSIMFFCCLTHLSMQNIKAD